MRIAEKADVGLVVLLAALGSLFLARELRPHEAVSSCEAQVGVSDVAPARSHFVPCTHGGLILTSSPPVCFDDGLEL
jgi:hypothetical protein